MNRNVHRWGGMLFAISMLLLAQYLSATGGRDAEFRGVATLLLGGAVFMGIVIWETRGPKGLLSVSEGGVFLADQSSLVWLIWLAWLGVAMGVAHGAANLIGVSLETASQVLLVLGDLWFIAIGIIFMRQGRDASPVYSEGIDPPIVLVSGPSRRSRMRGITRAFEAVRKRSVHDVRDRTNGAAAVLFESTIQAPNGHPADTELESALATTPVSGGPSLAQPLGPHPVRRLPPNPAQATGRGDGESWWENGSGVPHPREIPVTEWESPDESRALVGPVHPRSPVDAEENPPQPDVREAPQIAARAEPVIARPRTFHQWLNGGRLAGDVLRVLREDVLEDPMELPFRVAGTRATAVGATAPEPRNTSVTDDTEPIRPQSRAFREWLEA